MFDPFSLAGIATIVVAVKAYCAAHGAAITVMAVKAGIMAAMKGKSIKIAAMKAGATEAAADLLQDFLRGRF